MTSIRDWCPDCNETGWACKCRTIPAHPEQTPGTPRSLDDGEVERGLVDRLPGEWEENAESVRQIDADRDYRNYWRGYATALDNCARVLRARAAIAAQVTK